MKKYTYLIPWFPISVIVFCIAIFIGSNNGIIPSFYDIINWFSGLYETYGLPALFLASMLESIAYLGLYFPGSAVIALSVLVSDGSYATFLAISFSVAVAISIGCSVSYYCGNHKLLNKQNITSPISDASGISLWFWFVFNHWHPNAIGLWFFKRGFEKQSIFPFVFLVIPIMFSWGFICCVVIYSLREYAESDQTYAIFSILGIWVAIDVTLKYFRSKKPKVRPLARG